MNKITHIAESPDFPPDTIWMELDGHKMRNKEQLFDTLTDVLEFPEHFGRNLDALYDTLCDLSLPEDADGVLIAIRNAQDFLIEEDSISRKNFLEVISDASQPENRYDDNVFKVFFITEK